MTISPIEFVGYAWIVWLASWLLAASCSSRVERRSRSVAYIFYRLFTAAGALLLFGLHPSWRQAGTELWRLGNCVSWALAAVTISGFAFAWWARITLGRLWSSSVTRKVHHEVVSAGPYRVVRHPIYSGILLSVV